MKKLVFTAIAMIAFSGASMSNTKEVKKALQRTACDAGWIQQYQNGLDLGFDSAFCIMCADTWAKAHHC